MSVECDEMGGINLSQGICDLPLPEVLMTGIQEAVHLGYNHYTRCEGIPYLRDQIADKVRKYNHIDCDANKNVTVSCGATGALHCACYALFNVGDEVVLFEPFYGYHEYTLLSLDLKPVYVKLEEETWEIDFEVLENVISEKTRAILVSTPLNPCGKIFTKQEFIKIAQICEKYNLILLSDEIYEYITFEQKAHLSPASLPELSDRTITISGYSKTFSITGWRIGYAIASEEITKMISVVNDLLYVCAPAPVQYAVAKAIEELPFEYYVSIRDGYEQKRNLLCNTLSECGMKPYVPEGAYYIMANSSVLPGEKSKDKAMFLLKEAGIGAVPGEAFYSDGSGTNMLRFCFAKDISVIKEACDLLVSNKNKW